MAQIISNQVDVVQEFIKHFTHIHNQFFNFDIGLGLKFLFMPGLSEIDGINNIHRLKERNGQFSATHPDSGDIRDVPTIFWERLPLADHPELREKGRTRSFSPIDGDSDVVQTFLSYSSNMSINMKFYTTNIALLEVFELFYQAHVHPNSSFQVQYDFLQSPWTYNVTYGDVNALTVYDGDDYIALTLDFSAEIKGEFFILMGEYPYIKVLQRTYRDVFGEKLVQQTANLFNNVNCI